MIVSRRVRQAVCLAVIAAQSVMLLVSWNRDPEWQQVLRETSQRLSSMDTILDANTTVLEFGWMGRKVSSLIDLAQHYMYYDFLDSTELDALVTEAFPWFNSSRLDYVPWSRNSASDLSPSTSTSWKMAAGAQFDKVLGKMQRPKKKKKTTGIVISVSDGFAEEAAKLISYLRNVHASTLPIEIVYLSNDDLSPPKRNFLSRLGPDISFIDLFPIFEQQKAGIFSYAVKPFAMLASKFERVILLDADVVMFESLDAIFEDYPGLSETGILTFHDRYYLQGDTRRHEWLQMQVEAAGRPPSENLARKSLFTRRYATEEADSAIVVMDKSRVEVYLTLMFTCWMNSQPVRDALTWGLWWGDKETYWLAAELAGVPYTFEPWYSARLAQSPAPEGAVRAIEKAAREKAEREKAAEEVEKLPAALAGYSAEQLQQLLDDLQKHRPENHQERPELSKREVSPDSPAAASDTLGDNHYFTQHMAHIRPDGTAPMWANGALWLDKRRREFGLADWTHWYVGDRIEEVIATIDNGTTDHYIWPPLQGPAKEGDETPSIPRLPEHPKAIDDTQASWMWWDWDRDARELEQHDATRWKRLTPDFRRRVDMMIKEAEYVEVAWKEAFED